MPPPKVEPSQINTNNSSYNNQFSVFILAPLIVALPLIILNYVSDAYGKLPYISAFIGLLSLAAYIAFIYGYVRELKIIKNSYPARNLKYHFIFIVCGFLLPTLAVVIGDTQGAIEFGSESSGGILELAPLFGLTIGLFVWYVVGLGNHIFLRTNGQSNAVRILGKIVHVILWFFVGISSYILYSLAYSLRDPSTE